MGSLVAKQRKNDKANLARFSSYKNLMLKKHSMTLQCNITMYEHSLSFTLF